jgi:glycogen debranching enzyme
VGYENMAWKDSGDAVMYPNGSLVKGPKALCELQGYVYNAWMRMAEVFDALGQPERASELRSKASNLFARFNEAFWDEELGFYAYALDGDKNKVLSIASNAGHCLWSGIVPPERAKKVMERLTAPDMWTGWGIRTLSADHSAFNPYNYQTGSVWPHDNAIIAMGFKRYGFHKEVGRIAHDVSLAAGHFLLNQLPELYTASERNESNLTASKVLWGRQPQPATLMIFGAGGDLTKRLVIPALYHQASGPVRYYWGRSQRPDHRAGPRA